MGSMSASLTPVRNYWGRGVSKTTRLHTTWPPGNPLTFIPLTHLINHLRPVATHCHWEKGVGIVAVFMVLGGWRILDTQPVGCLYVNTQELCLDTWWVEGVTQLQLLSTQPLSRSSCVHLLPSLLTIYVLTALSLSFIFNPFDRERKRAIDIS